MTHRTPQEKFLKQKIIAPLAALACTWAAGQATAADLGNLASLSQDAYAKLSKDLGAAAAYRGVTPGNSLGITGFDVGIELTQTKIENSAILKQAGGGDNSNLFIPKLHVLKGLPFGFDVGAFVSRVSGVNASLYGAELRYQIIEDGLTTPSLALRVSGSKLSGVSQTSLSTFAVDAMLSKKLAFITPYIGAGSVHISDQPKVGTLSDARSTQSRVFVGVNANFLVTNFAVEAEKLGGVSSVSAKVGFRF
jgi:hypothetical protein